MQPGSAERFELVTASLDWKWQQIRLGVCDNDVPVRPQPGNADDFPQACVFVALNEITCLTWLMVFSFISTSGTPRAAVKKKKQVVFIKVQVKNNYLALNNSFKQRFASRCLILVLLLDCKWTHAQKKKNQTSAAEVSYKSAYGKNSLLRARLTETRRV